MEIVSRRYNSSTSAWNGKNNSIALVSMFESQEDDGLWVLQNSILPDSIPQIENVGNDSLKRLDRHKYVKCDFDKMECS